MMLLVTGLMGPKLQSNHCLQISRELQVEILEVRRLGKIQLQHHMSRSTKRCTVTTVHHMDLRCRELFDVLLSLCGRSPQCSNTSAPTSAALVPSHHPSAEHFLEDHLEQSDHREYPLSHRAPLSLTIPILTSRFSFLLQLDHFFPLQHCLHDMAGHIARPIQRHVCDFAYQAHVRSIQRAQIISGKSVHVEDKPQTNERLQETDVPHLG